MAPRRVIADSDDEDVIDEILDLIEPEIEDPAPELLSPQHEPVAPAKSSIGHLSNASDPADATDPSFFAAVYNESQDQMLQQASLIENIIRQSHLASRSNDDVPLPAVGKGERPDASSATNADSPIVLVRASANQFAMLNEDEFCSKTPRKSIGGEWDMPSSAEGAAAPPSSWSSKGRKQKTYGDKKRSRAKNASSSASRNIFMNEDLLLGQDSETLPTDAHQSVDNDEVEDFALPAPKRRRLSTHDLASPDTPNFYVAQSNLTTMQKLEYQRISVSSSGYAGLPGSLGNNKSSGTTTVAHSTPSRFASSEKPLPWEAPSGSSILQGSPREILDISSSPVFIAPEDSTTENRISAVESPAEAQEYERRPVPPIGIRETSPPKEKAKRVTRSTQETDELAQDDSWDPDAIGYQREMYKPRPSRRRPNVIDEVEEDGQRPVVEEYVPELPADDAMEVLPPIPEPVVDDIAASEAFAVQAAPLPKKRGRKKRQPDKELVSIDEVGEEDEMTIPELPNSEKESAPPEPSTQKPKKRRGRPRKSGTAETEIVAVEPIKEIPPTIEESQDAIIASSPDDLALEEPSEPEEDNPPRTKKKQKQASQKGKAKVPKKSSQQPTRHTEQPLKELDRNTRTPSQSLSHSSSEVPGKTAKTNPLGGENPAAGSKAETKKEEASKAATAAASQAKALYRVGLSKKSRIAPLLKMIKK